MTIPAPTTALNSPTNSRGMKIDLEKGVVPVFRKNTETIMTATPEECNHFSFEYFTGTPLYCVFYKIHNYLLSGQL